MIYNFPLLLLIISVCDSAKILFTVMPGEKSHALSMRPFAEGLARAGHNVSFSFESYAPLIQVSKLVPNIGVELTGQDPNADLNPISEVLWVLEFRPLTEYIPWIQNGVRALDDVHEKGLQDKLNQIRNEKWDLVLVDSLFCVPGMTIAWEQSLVARMHSSQLAADAASAYGLERALAVTAPHQLTHDTCAYDHKLFTNRLFALKQYAELELLLMLIHSPIRSAMHRFGVMDFSFHKFDQEITSMNFYDFPNMIGFTDALTHEITNVASACHTINVNPLPKEFTDFIEDPESQGTILISLGSITDYFYAPQSTLDAFVGAFESLPEFRFIWSYRGPELTLPKNVKAVTWLPQSDVLNHPKTKLFVGHGGLKSVKESICAAKPVLFLPMFAEQLFNSFFVIRKGSAEYLDKFSLTPEYLLQKIRTVLDNPDYEEKAISLRRKWSDQIMDLIDVAVHRTNLLLRHGAKLTKWVRPKASFVTFVQRYHLEQAIFGLVLVLIVK